MKLQELAVANPTKQAARVFESYFGKTLSFDSVSAQQARGMLRRVRDTIAEHRRTPEFHTSEQNPAYLKLVVMEQALAARVQEQDTVQTMDPTEQARQRQQQRTDIDKSIGEKQRELADLQRQKAMMERRQNLRSRLQEASEVQQAQVVLASQDMVDQVQGMSEDISAMQFKDLPALTDSIKNDMGVDQATAYQSATAAALTQLLQSVQQGKTALEGAQGTLTGQEPVVPGQEPAADMGADLNAEPAADMGADLNAEPAADMGADEEEPTPLGAPEALGRDRRVAEAKKGKKPDFLDLDKDGNKKETMKSAAADKKAGPKKGVNPFAKKK